MFNQFLLFNPFSLIIRISAIMKQSSLDRYLFKKNIGPQKKVQLELSESDEHEHEQALLKKKQRLKLYDLFSNRVKNKPNTSATAINQDLIKKIDHEAPKQQKFFRPSYWEKPEPKKPPESQREFEFTPKKTNQVKLTPERQQRGFKNELQEVRIYQSYFPKNYRSTYLENRSKQIEEEKKLKRQQKKQEQKKKLEEQSKKKNQTFKKFLGNITGRMLKALPNKNDEGQLKNITMFNQMEEQNMEKMLVDKKQINPKAAGGLIYQKLTMERQKVPLSFLKLLLSYKFSAEILEQQQKKVPNAFEDQMTYKKIFHYLVVNQCIADLHLRLKKIQQGEGVAVPITISNFKANSNGFIEFSMNEHMKENTQANEKEKKQKFVLKNFSLSRNRLGLVTNAKNFKIDHYGIPSKKNERIFAFMCLLVTPESKEDLNSETKGLCSIETENLDLILKLNKTNKCYFYDLQKISTHLREYQAISHLYFTEVASYIYNPSLIQNHQLDMIPQEQSQKLGPILAKIKKEFNATQYESIREMALREVGIVLLQGPPGTGKTTTLMGLLAVEYQYLKNVCAAQDKRKILICAPSNAAIDHITKRLVCQGLITTNNGSLSHSGDSIISERVFPKILRVGIVETDDPDIIGVSLDDICDKQMNKVKQNVNKRNAMTTTQVKQKIISLSKEINKIKNRKDLQDWEKEKKIMDMKYEIKGYENMLYVSRKERIERKQTYSQIENKLFDEADIILTTLSSSGSEKMEKLRGFIGCLIIDEAAQATEPTILIPLQSGARKVLLIGDPCQLPATTMSQDSSVTLFNRSLFQRFLDNGVRPYFLNMQYRMAPLIRQFPSKVFYQNRLVDAESVKERYIAVQESENKQLSRLQAISQFFSRNSLFIDVKFGEEEFNSNSFRNLGECLVLKNLILDFIKKTKLTIGVITPYQAQKKHLLKELRNSVEDANDLAEELKRYSEANKQKSQNFDELNDDNSGIIEQIGDLEGIKQKNEYANSQGNKNLKQNQMKIGENTDKEKKEKSFEQLLQERIMINTVDSFQGQEKDIIIVSTVRANNRRDIGFMKDQRRINVALTRSKHLLIVVGNGNTMGSNQIWNQYLEWAQRHRCYYQIRSREDIQSTIYQLNQNFNNEAIQRVRYDKLSRDLRKLSRTEIKKEDFGIRGSKKVKRQKNDDESSRKQQETNKQMRLQIKDSTERDKLIEEDEKKAEELIEQKRAREQEARNLEQVNRRIKQLQEKMKMDENNPYARLFS